MRDNREQVIAQASSKVEGVRLTHSQRKQPDTLDLWGMFTCPVLAELNVTGRLPLNAEVSHDDS
jgi:hypothetical protein